MTRARLKDERGFSLLELQVAELIGGFVITSAILMMIVAVNSSNRVTDRVNAAQVGRNAMEQVQQRLRSQTCLFPLEYKVNGSTTSTGALASIVHADGDKIIFIGDIANTVAPTSSGGGIDFRPQLRYIYLVPDATGRRGTLVEGWRSASTTTSPYNYVLTPLSSFDQMASVAGAASKPPERYRAMADGVGNMVAETAPVGATAPTVPLFRYFDAADVAIAEDSSIGAIPTSELGGIAKITVGFKVFGLTNKDAVGPSNTDDRRTATFRNEIYLRTVADRCQ